MILFQYGIRPPARDCHEFHHLPKPPVIPPNPNFQPQVAQQMWNPAPQQQMGNPPPAPQQMGNPAPQQQMVNPALQQQMGNPAPQQQMGNPAPQQQMVNPVPQQMVNPGAQQMGEPCTTVTTTCTTTAPTSTTPATTTSTTNDWDSIHDSGSIQEQIVQKRAHCQHSGDNVFIGVLAAINHLHVIAGNLWDVSSK